MTCNGYQAVPHKQIGNQGFRGVSPVRWGLEQWWMSHLKNDRDEVSGIIRHSLRRNRKCGALRLMLFSTLAQFSNFSFMAPILLPISVFTNPEPRAIFLLACFAESMVASDALSAFSLTVPKHFPNEVLLRSVPAPFQKCSSLSRNPLTN